MPTASTAPKNANLPHRPAIAPPDVSKEYVSVEINLSGLLGSRVWFVRRAFDADLR
jgi:hypothetical protein